MGDVFIEKCLEHYLTYLHLNISEGDIYIDVASGGSPWAGILNARGGEGAEVRGQKNRGRRQGRGRAYRLDLSFPKGTKGIDIGADAGDTKLPDSFASVLSSQCAYECFMGDADILFVEEASRILDKKGRYGIASLYLSDIHFVSTSPYCNQAEDGKQKTEVRSRRSDITKSVEFFLTFLWGVGPYGPEADIGRLTSGRRGRRPGRSGEMMHIRCLSQGTIRQSLLLRGYIRGYRATCQGRFFILKTLMML